MATLDGDAVHAFGTTTSAAQAVALYQAVQKLVHERRDSLRTSLHEIEKFMRRRWSAASAARTAVRTAARPSSPISLDTDVVVMLKALNLGVFPSTLSDHQVFKVEALNAYARFAATIE